MGPNEKRTGSPKTKERKVEDPKKEMKEQPETMANYEKEGRLKEKLVIEPTQD